MKRPNSTIIHIQNGSQDHNTWQNDLRAYGESVVFEEQSTALIKKYTGEKPTI